MQSVRLIWIVWIVVALPLPLWARSSPGTRAPNTINGSIEAGFVFGGPPADSQWLVDQLEWNQRFDASERVHFVFNNLVSLQSNSNLPGFNNSRNYVSHWNLGTGQFQIANSGAYLEMVVSDAVVLSLGHLHTPFGNETQVSRYDSVSYFYSGALAAARSYAWLWDLGLGVEVTRAIPGRFVFALLDGRGTTTGQPTPAFSLRYEYNWDFAGLSIQPTASAYFGKWAGGPQDLGVSLGFALQAGRLNLVTEYVYAKQDATRFAGSLTETTSLYLEPSLQTGWGDFALKGEWQASGGARDLHLGVTYSKHIADKVRLRVLYQFAGINAQIRSSNHDFRLLLGTHW